MDLMGLDLLKIVGKATKHDSTNDDLATVIPKKSPFSTISKTTPRSNKDETLKKEKHNIQTFHFWASKKREVFFGVCADPPKSGGLEQLIPSKRLGRERLIYSPATGSPPNAGRRRLKLLLGTPNGGLEG